MRDETSCADAGPFAREFAAAQRAAGFRLDFTLDSLKSEVDRLIEASILQPLQSRLWTEQEEHCGTGLTAYTGETLCRLHDGVWGGSFSRTQTIGNWYCSYILFGEYRYSPAAYFLYRFSNGPKDGTFSQYLERVLPLIQARKRD